MSETEDLSWMLQPFDGFSSADEKQCLAKNELLSSKKKELENSADCAKITHGSQEMLITARLSGCKSSESAVHSSELQTDKLDLEKHYIALKSEVEKNQETLRKLKLVKAHRAKNSLSTLDTLIMKWKRVSQDALTELNKYSSKNPPTTMLQLLHFLSVDPLIVNFDVKSNSFSRDGSCTKNAV